MHNAKNDAKLAKISVHRAIQERERTICSGYIVLHGHRSRSSTSTVMQECKVFRLELAQMDLTPNWITVDTMNHRREKTSKDPLLTLLHKMLLSDWTSERKDTPEVIRAYWSFRDEISVQDDVPHESIKSSCLHL